MAANLSRPQYVNDDQEQQRVIEVDLQEGHSDMDQGYSSDDQTSTNDEGEYKTVYTIIWKYIKEKAWTQELQRMLQTKQVTLLEEVMPPGEAHQSAYIHVLPTLEAKYPGNEYR